MRKIRNIYFPCAACGGALLHGRELAIVGLLVGIGIISILAVILLPILGRVREKARYRRELMEEGEK